MEYYEIDESQANTTPKVGDHCIDLYMGINKNSIIDVIDPKSRYLYRIIHLDELVRFNKNINKEHLHHARYAHELDFMN